MGYKAIELLCLAFFGDVTHDWLLLSYSHTCVIAYCWSVTLCFWKVRTCEPPFTQAGDFFLWGGGNMRCHRILHRSIQSAWGSVRTCSILDLFYLTYIWRLLCSFLPLCNSICQVRYRPPWTHLSAGAAVFLSSLLSACLSSSVSALRPPSGRWSWPQVSHLEKPPHLANIPVTVRTLTGSNRLCDESKCSWLTIRHAIAFLEVKAPEQEIASTSLTQEDGEYFYLFLYRLPSPLQGIQALWQILILISLWGQLQ